MFELFFIVLCLVLNALLSCSETAFIALSKPMLKAMIKQGNQKATLLLKLRENPERTLSIIQIGITFLGAFAAAIGGAGAEESIAPWLSEKFKIRDSFAEMIAIFLVVLPLTYASVVFGELVPKTFALRRPAYVATLTLPWFNVLSRLISPIINIFEWSTKKIIDFFPKKHTSYDEVETDLEATLEETLSPLNKQYIMNMVKIERTQVKEILVPWKDVVFINVNDSIKEVEQIVIGSAHTRLPVVREKKVIGILHSKEFLAFQKTGEIEWLNLCRQTIHVQESTLILTTLRLLQEKKAHMAIVFDGIYKTGIITMESIFEEIIGDIYDEDDDGAIQKILARKRFV